MPYDREQPGNTVLAPAWIIALTILSGCSGRQSALAPAGDEAEAIFQLFLVMVIGGSGFLSPACSSSLNVAVLNRGRRKTRGA
jgi:hypothetical protein